MSNFFKILRPGINSTFQDLGRFGLQHLGIVPSGCMDKLLFSISIFLNNGFGLGKTAPLIKSSGCQFHPTKSILLSHKPNKYLMLFQVYKTP